MKAFKVELFIINQENISEEDIIYELENLDYLHSTILSIKSKEIGEWHYDHPLNKKETIQKTANDLFEENNKT